MSKIGRRPIQLGSVQVEVKGSELHFKGKQGSGVYRLPATLKAELVDKQLFLKAADTNDVDNEVWGLHRALISNSIAGADKKFEKELKIVGLGFKVAVAGSKLNFSLGYSHKIDFNLPEGLSAEVDKTGQILTVRSASREALGLACSQIRALRPPEPYKGTGIQYAQESVRRKVGKAK